MNYNNQQPIYTHYECDGDMTNKRQRVDTFFYENPNQYQVYQCTNEMFAYQQQMLFLQQQEYLRQEQLARQIAHQVAEEIRLTEFRNRVMANNNQRVEPLYPIPPPTQSVVRFIPQERGTIDLTVEPRRIVTVKSDWQLFTGPEAQRKRIARHLRNKEVEKYKRENDLTDQQVNALLNLTDAKIYANPGENDIIEFNPKTGEYRSKRVYRANSNIY